VEPLVRSGRSGFIGGRSYRGLGDDHEFKRCSVSLERHHIFVEGELDRGVQRNDMLLVGLWLSNGVVRGAGADDILMAQEINTWRYLALGRTY